MSRRPFKTVSGHRKETPVIGYRNVGPMLNVTRVPNHYWKGLTLEPGNDQNVSVDNFIRFVQLLPCLEYGNVWNPQNALPLEGVRRSSVGGQYGYGYIHEGFYKLQRHGSDTGLFLAIVIPPSVDETPKATDPAPDDDSKNLDGYTLGIVDDILPIKGVTFYGEEVESYQFLFHSVFNREKITLEKFQNLYVTLHGDPSQSGETAYRVDYLEEVMKRHLFHVSEKHAQVLLARVKDETTTNEILISTFEQIYRLWEQECDRDEELPYGFGAWFNETPRPTSLKYHFQMTKNEMCSEQFFSTFVHMPFEESVRYTQMKSPLCQTMAFDLHKFLRTNPGILEQPFTSVYDRYVAGQEKPYPTEQKYLSDVRELIGVSLTEFESEKETIDEIVNASFIKRGSVVPAM